MCSFPDSTTENAPVASKIPVPVSTVPVMFRISSLCHWPAPSSPPGAQFRKDCWHLQKSSSGRWLRRAKGFSEIGGREMLTVASIILQECQGYMVSWTKLSPI